jgi:subtilisin family serine protease
VDHIVDPYGHAMGPPRRRTHRRARGGGALAVAVLVATLAGPGAALRPAPARAEAPPPGSDRPVEVDDTEATAQAAAQALVRLEQGADPAAVLRDLDVDPSAVVQRYGDHGFALVADDDLRARLAAHEGVAGVDADAVVRALGEVPPNVARIRGPEAHAAGFDGGPSAGRTIRVAVVDTGIDLDHPDLVGNIDAALGKDCTRTGSPDDDHYHGTHVAGTVAAVANGVGVLGVAPAARLVPVKVLSGSGSGTRADVICGLEHVLALATDGDPSNDVQVVNMSLGGSGSAGSSCAADLERAVICKLTAAGVAVVVSAGNSSADAKSFLPAGIPEAITVSAMDDATDAMASFSNYGAGVDITGPGVNVLSSKLGGGTRYLSGTSMSSPAVAGTVAVLMAAADPGSPEEINRLLRSTGECPDHTRAGEDETCAGQGTWPGDRDSIVEPLVDVAESALLIGAEVRFVAPRRLAVVNGIVPTTVRTGDGPGTATVRVRVDGGTWQTAAPEAGTGLHTVAWDTTAVGEGVRRIEAEVTEDGTPTALTTDVVVRNGPMPTIEAPAAAAVARGAVVVSVRVTHPTQALDGLSVVLHAPQGEDTVPVPLVWDAATSRFTGTWDSQSVGDGPRSLRVVATDARDRTNETSTTVKVDNSPSVTITSPAAGLVGATVPLVVTATSPVHPAEALTLTWRAGSLSGPLARAGGNSFTGTWDTVTMPDGYAGLDVIATDPDGRTATFQRGVTVRNAPTVRLDTTAASGTMALRATATSALHAPETLTVTVKLSSVGTLPMTWDGTGFVTAPIDTRTWPDGWQYPTLTAKDPDGRTANAYPSLQVRNGPSLAFLEPTAGTVGGSLTVAVRVTDPDDPPAALEPKLLVDGAGTPVPLVYDAVLDRHRGTLDTVGLSDGSHQLVVSVTDPSGRTASATRYVTVRNTFTAEWSSPSEGAVMTAGSEARVRVTTYADPVSSVVGTLAVDGGSPVPLSYDAATGYHRAALRTHDWPDGPHRLDVQLQDPRGRTASLTRSVQFKNRPTISVVAPQEGARIQGWGNVEVNATDVGYSGFGVVLSAPGMQPVVMSYDWASASFKAPSFNSEVLPDGPRTLTFTITDGEGLTASATRGVVIANSPELGIVSVGGATVDGIVPLVFHALGPDGTEESLDRLEWTLERGGNGFPQPVATTAAEGDFVSHLDTTILVDGQYRLDVQARAKNGRTTTATRTLTVRHRSTFGVGFLSPASGVDQKGIVQVVAQAWGGQLSTNRSAPVSGWYRVDGGAWLHMPLWTGSTSAFAIRWDTRNLTPGTHRIEVQATDWRGGVAMTGVDVSVLHPGPALTIDLASSLTAQALDGIVVVQAQASGGSLEWDLTYPVSAWYRVDGGTWVYMSAWYGSQQSSLDTATLRPGSHRIEVAATDWVGGVAFDTADVVVAGRAPLTLQITAPTPGAGGRVPIAVTARATSTVVGPSGLSVFARAGTGAWVTLTLRDDGHFHGTVPVSSSVPNGSSVTIEAIATDYRGRTLPASTSYRVQR